MGFFFCCVLSRPDFCYCPSLLARPPKETEMRCKIDGDKDEQRHCHPRYHATCPYPPHAYCLHLPPQYMDVMFFGGVQICESLFSLLSRDTTYLFPLSCSLPRSSATILIPTSLGVSLAKHVHTPGDQPDGMGSVPPYLEWQLNVDPLMLHDFQHHIPHSILNTPTTPLLHCPRHCPTPPA